MPTDHRASILELQDLIATALEEHGRRMDPEFMAALASDLVDIQSVDFIAQLAAERITKLAHACVALGFGNDLSDEQLDLRVDFSDMVREACEEMEEDIAEEEDEDRCATDCARCDCKGVEARRDAEEGA